MNAENNLIEIHEFSTGIEVKSTRDGWESGGFTGKYMNRTIEQIPKAVLDSIANGEFALAEGTASEKPAIVGREVTGYGETWSVVAVVTRGRDDRGRGVSLYRYFLCSGGENIENILRWMGSKVLTFDPFDRKESGESYKVDPSKLSSEEVSLDKFQNELSQPLPIIIEKPKPCMPLILNKVTLKMENAGYRAWAYNVAALEKPEYFQVIDPADSQAEEVLRQVLARRQSQSIVPIAGEARIKTAIRAVMNGRPKREHIDTLENALKNPQINYEYWKSALDKEGASQMFDGNMYGASSVRLLTLKAMLIPKFLPNFLAWLTNSKASEKHYPASLDLQEAMLSAEPKFIENFPELSERLKRGICIVISRLVSKPKIFRESLLLLTSSSGLWSEVYQKSLSLEFENDLELMPKHFHKQKGLKFQAAKYPEWNELLGKILGFWSSRKKPSSEYSTLAMLFEKLETWRLAAIFYQIAEGSVPKSLFSKVFPPAEEESPPAEEESPPAEEESPPVEEESPPVEKESPPVEEESPPPLESKLFGMKINQKKELVDYAKIVFCNTINSQWIKICVYVGTGIFSLITLRALVYITLPYILVAILSAKEYTQKEEMLGANGDRESQKESSYEPKPLELSTENLNKYNKTAQAMTAIRNKLQQAIYNERTERGIITNETPEQVIFTCILKKLELPEDFEYNGEIGQDPGKWKKFSQAISDYQERKGGTPDGVIDPGKQTQTWLEQDIMETKCLE